MSYPLINGDTINGDDAGDGGVQTAGIELATAGVPEAVPVLQAAGSVALDVGNPRAVVPLRPAGIDLATGGQVTAFYNSALRPEGVELATGGVPAVFVVLEAGEHHALEFGAARVQLGVDVALLFEGIELVKTGLHGALPGQPPALQTLQAQGAVALELGEPEIGLKPLVVDAPGAHAMELGEPATRLTLDCAGVVALEVGDPATRMNA